MNFGLKKLPKEAISQLRRVPIGVCEPFAMLMVPVYVYLPMNGRFVVVKAALHHFTAAELQKYQPYENFYLPEFVDLLKPFMSVGETLRELLGLKQVCQLKTNLGSHRLELAVPQHELNDASLRAIEPLWDAQIKVEPLFLCFFSSEVCHPFEIQTITDAFERSVELFELAMLRSSCAIFLALHLGYCNAAALTSLRASVFSNSIHDTPPAKGAGELSELAELVWALVPGGDEIREVSLSRIRSVFTSTGVGGKVSQKIISRLERVQTEKGRRP